MPGSWTWAHVAPPSVERTVARVVRPSSCITYSTPPSAVGAVRNAFTFACAGTPVIATSAQGDGFPSAEGGAMRNVPTPSATYSSPPAASIPTATPRFHPSRHTPLSLRKPASTSDHVAPPSLLSNGPPSRSSLVHVSAVERNATSRCLASRGSTASAVAHALRLDVGRSNVVASHVLAPS